MQEVCTLLTSPPSPAQFSFKSIAPPDQSQQPSSQLADLTSTSLRFFNFQSSAWEPQVQFQQEIQVDEHSAWVVLKGGSVFCCGGGIEPGWKSAYLVVGRDVQRRMDMIEGRYVHGILALNAALYAFGGYRKSYSDNATCEKFQFVRNTWSQLPDMRGERSFFNPCLWKGVIYLCGYGDPIIEAFSPQNDAFLPFTIPLPNTSYNIMTCVYADTDFLVVHLHDRIVRFTSDSSGHLVLHTEVGCPQVTRYQSSQPVVDKTQGLFYLVYQSCCWSYSMETGAQIGKFT